MKFCFFSQKVLIGGGGGRDNKVLISFFRITMY